MKYSRYVPSSAFYCYSLEILLARIQICRFHFPEMGCAVLQCSMPNCIKWSLLSDRSPKMCQASFCLLHSFSGMLFMYHLFLLDPASLGRGSVYRKPREGSGAHCGERIGDIRKQMSEKSSLAVLWTHKQVYKSPLTSSTLHFVLSIQCWGHRVHRRVCVRLLWTYKYFTWYRSGENVTTTVDALLVLYLELQRGNVEFTSWDDVKWRSRVE